jgi:hypothetical protein
MYVHFLWWGLAAKDHVQKQGIDYDEMFSPVARYITVQLSFVHCVLSELSKFIQ